MSSARRIVVIGLTLSSSWGNGHATTYRALLKALAARGHDITFLEQDRPWYAQARDLQDPPYCRLLFYDSPMALSRFRRRIEAADLTVIGSYVSEGAAVARRVRGWARRLAFYDIDTPVTLAALRRGRCEYLARDTVPLFDHYFSFTGGPVLRRLEAEFGAVDARALHCAVDPELYRRQPSARRWHMGYLGTFSEDRQPALEALLLEPARRAPQLRFVVAGSQYPAGIAWPANVERVEHLPPASHAGFYSSLGVTLNVTRTEMVRAGYSPSVRLFEAASCATPVISDPWPGMGSFFRIGTEILVAERAEQVLAMLAWPEAALRRIGEAARLRVLGEHTAAHRALALEDIMGKRLWRPPPTGSAATLLVTDPP